MSIFIGGTINISTLKPLVLTKLNSIIENKLSILIGDANGVDKAVQFFLESNDYKNVTVYYSGTKPRNNIGNWPVKLIETESKKRNREFFTKKDEAMAKIASFGFMIWNRKSEGTLNNIVNLLNLNKKVCLFDNIENKIIFLKSIEDLDNFILSLNSEELFTLLKKLKNKSNKELKSHFENIKPKTTIQSNIQLILIKK